jgi:hypothetical protein
VVILDGGDRSKRLQQVTGECGSEREVCEEAVLLCQPTRDEIIVQAWFVAPETAIERANARIWGGDLDVSTRIRGKESLAVDDDDAASALQSSVSECNCTK